MTVEFLGDIFITKNVVLRDVLYIPEFKYNLLSVSALLKDKRYSIFFSNVDCIIQDKLLLKTIGKVELINGLYLLYTHHEKDKSCSIKHTALICKASTLIWHKRIGHPLIARLKNLSHIPEISYSLNGKEIQLNNIIFPFLPYIMLLNIFLILVNWDI